MINILLGISSHSGKFACYICYGKSELVSGPLRTYKNLAAMYKRYEEAGFPEKEMSQYWNVIKPCLINPDDLTLKIGDVIPITQLPNTKPSSQIHHPNITYITQMPNTPSQIPDTPYLLFSSFVNLSICPPQTLQDR